MAEIEQVSLTQFAYILHSIPHLGPTGIRRLLNTVPDGSSRRIDLGSMMFWNMSEEGLIHEYKLHPNSAMCIANQKDRLLDAGLEIAVSAGKFGIKVMTILDPDYPSFFRASRLDPPPIIYSFGNPALISERKFAVIGSSTVSPSGVETMRNLAGIMADDGLTTVTSHNTPGYQVVGLAAKSRNAPVVLVLDRGILCAFPNGMRYEPVAQARIWDMRFDPSRDLVLSQFRLYDPWIGANGRERDRMIFDLADVLVAVDVRAGGVMEGECTRAHERGREVYVYTSERTPTPAGNANLLEKGCPPIPSRWARSLLTTLDLPHAEDKPEE
jgi:DNA processing protein